MGIVSIYGLNKRIFKIFSALLSSIILSLSLFNSSDFLDEKFKFDVFSSNLDFQTRSFRIPNTYLVRSSVSLLSAGLSSGSLKIFLYLLFQQYCMESQISSP